MLLRNGSPWPSRVVSVRVVDPAGSEILAATVVPETSEPGFYAIAWIAPALVGQAMALWTSGLKTWSEPIEIIAAASLGGSSQAIVGIIPGDESTPLVGIVDRDEQLDGVLDREADQLTGVVADSHNVDGILGREDSLAGILEET